jgi:hypothetical protein
MERLDAFHAGGDVRASGGWEFFGSVHENLDRGAGNTGGDAGRAREFYAVEPPRSNALIQKSGASV